MGVGPVIRIKLSTNSVTNLWMNLHIENVKVKLFPNHKNLTKVTKDVIIGNIFVKTVVYNWIVNM